MNTARQRDTSRVLWITAATLLILILVQLLPGPSTPALAAMAPGGGGDYHFAVSSSGGDENTGDLFWVLDDHAGTLLLYQAQEEKGEVSIVFRDGGDIARMFDAAR